MLVAEMVDRLVETVAAWRVARKVGLKAALLVDLEVESMAEKLVVEMVGCLVE